MYNRPRIIPVLLIDNQDLVKTVQFSNPTYLGDPVNAVKIFNIKGIDELSILDISATKTNKEPDFEFLKDITSQAFMPLSYGGGVKNMEQIKKLFSIGFEKVVVNSAFYDNPELIREAAEYAGSQSIVVSIDVKKIKGQYKVVTYDGKKILDINPVDYAKKAEEFGAGEIFLNSIDNDGIMLGYDIELVKSVAEAVNIPVIACGGAGGIADLKEVLQDGKAHAAAGGSMFVYYGKLKAVLITAPSEKELIEANIFQGI